MDEQLAIEGLTDLSVPVDQFARLALPVERVFITENEINGLVFPGARGSIVIFGLGYGVQVLAGVEWLREKPVYYWGDIDTHGFAILDRLRSDFPDMRSFLMDRATLLEHRELWGRKGERYEGEFTRLTGCELELAEGCGRIVLGIESVWSRSG